MIDSAAGSSDINHTTDPSCLYLVPFDAPLQQQQQQQQQQLKFHSIPMRCGSISIAINQGLPGPENQRAPRRRHQQEEEEEGEEEEEMENGIEILMGNFLVFVVVWLLEEGDTTRSDPARWDSSSPISLLLSFGSGRQDSITPSQSQFLLFLLLLLLLLLFLSLMPSLLLLLLLNQSSNRIQVLRNPTVITTGGIIELI